MAANAETVTRAATPVESWRRVGVEEGGRSGDESDWEAEDAITTDRLAATPIVAAAGFVAGIATAERV